MPDRAARNMQARKPQARGQGPCTNGTANATLRQGRCSHCAPFSRGDQYTHALAHSLALTMGHDTARAR
eukprot:10679702-Alexandrium_andersonii.AAC.1